MQRSALFCTCLAGLVAAASFTCPVGALAATTVIGTVKDATGTVLATGEIWFQLSQEGIVTDPAILITPPVKCDITAGVILAPGGGACSLRGNDEISPTGTVYRVRILSATGRQFLAERTYSITGPTWDIGTQTPNPSSVQTGIHGASLHSGDVIPPANQEFGAFYSDFSQIPAPSNPAAGTRRFFVDSATGELSVRTSAGSIVSLEAAGGGGSGDITSVGDCATGACFQSVAANQVLAAPDGAAGQAAFRALVDADLPATNALDSELHAQSHVLDGGDHTVSGLTIGNYVRALTATTFGFAAILDADLPASVARDSELHAQSHVLDGADHTVSGLTIGNYVRALTATTFGFATILDGDLPATIARDSELHAQVHALVGADHTASGLTVGQVPRATGATAFAWQQLGFSDLVGSATDAQVSNTITLDNLTQITTRSITVLSGIATDAQVDGSLEADELVLAGDVDGVANANDLDELAVEAELEAVLDHDQLQLAGLTAGQVYRATAATTAGWGALDLADADARTGLLPDANLADVLANTVMLRNAGTTGVRADVKISALTEEATPLSGDWILGETAEGDLRRYNVGNLPTGGGGEANTHSSDGGGLALTAATPKVGVDLRLVSLAAADFDLAADLFTIDDSKWAKDSELHTIFSPNADPGVDHSGLSGGVGITEVGGAISFDATEIGAVTWLDNADRVWTFDIAAAGVNPTIAFAASSIEVDANLTVDDEQELRLKEEDAGGENYVGFKAPAAVTANGVCTLLDSTTDIIPDTCVGGILANELIDLATEVNGILDEANLDANVVLDPRTITVAGTANEITSSAGAQDLSVNRTWTLSLPATIDLGGKTSFEIPNAAAPVVDAFGEIAGDNDFYAASRGVATFFDGTSATHLVGVLNTDTPANGQVPKWNTGGTITWENDDDSGGSPTLDSIIAAVGAASINSGDNAIGWNWSLTTADKVAFKISENVASVATGNPVLFNLSTLAASTAHPFQVTSRGDTNGLRVGATDGVLVELGTGGVDFGALLNYPTACSNSFVRAIADTPTCNTVGTSDIAGNAADNTIIRDSAGFSVIGKTATGTGDPADIVAADETVLGRTGAGNLVFAQVATGQIAANAITDALLRDSAATSIIGRSAGTTGDPADIATSTDGQVLRRAAGALGFGALDLADTDAVTGVLPDANVAITLSRDSESVASGDVSGSLSAGYTIDAGAVASPELATANKIFKCNFVLFRDTGLKDSDDIETISNCSRPGRAITITEVIAETDAGSPVINLQRDDGTPANLLSSNCTATTGGATCSIAAAEDNFAATDRLDFVAVSGMTGANRISITITGTVD